KVTRSHRFNYVQSRQEGRSQKVQLTLESCFTESIREQPRLRRLVHDFGITIVIQTRIHHSSFPAGYTLHESCNCIVRWFRLIFEREQSGTRYLYYFECRFRRDSSPRVNERGLRKIVGRICEELFIETGHHDQNRNL